MSILDDMDRAFVANRPLPPGAAWLIGCDCWHALMADMHRVYRDKPWPPFDPKKPPRELFGIPLRHMRRMHGWALAQALDPELAVPQSEASPASGRCEGVDAR